MSRTLRIGLLMGLVSDPFWVRVLEAIYQKAHQLSINLISIHEDLPLLPSGEEETALFEELQVQELDALIGWGFPEGLAPRVLAAGTPIIHLTETDFQHPLSFSPLGLSAAAQMIGDSWIDGHGTFCLTTHEIPILGLFVWMPNPAHEAKRLASEIVSYTGLIETVCMDSKADDQKLYLGLKEDYRMRLITRPRRGKNKSASRKQMIREMWTHANRIIFRQRSTTVEPMQGLVKQLFDLERGWMHGNENNRWLFAAMGVAVQMAQRLAWLDYQSTWNIKHSVFGV